VTASLYVHAPFCAGACDYCDFYSVAVTQNDPRLDRYIDRLLHDAEKLLAGFKTVGVPALYIGGGTPSVLGAGGITRLLTGLLPLLPNVPAEITLEANPESADERFLRAGRDAGVTRISLGVQSFNEESRRAVHRVGEGRLIPGRLELVRQYFPGAFSADLITGLPFQENSVLLRDIEKLLAFEPAHVSLYALTPEPGTPLAAARPQNLPAGDEADALWISGRDALEAAGYAQYEVSNFALNGKESRHNMRYWRMEQWLGLGPGASGTIINDDEGTGLRYTVKPDVDAWLERPVTDSPPQIVEELDKLTLMKETVLMGFRCLEGPDTALFKKRFNGNIEETIPKTLARWRKRGLLQNHKTALTKDGLLLLDPFLIEAFSELSEVRG
jgi:oxygen-independent coproporphyrinogen-3 oxidase